MFSIASQWLFGLLIIAKYKWEEKAFRGTWSSNQVITVHPPTTRASLIIQSVKNLPAMQETQVQFLGREDPLEKELATHSNKLAWEIPWTEEPGGLRSLRLQRVRYNWSDLAHTRILEWVAYPISSGSSQPRNWTRVSCIAGGFFTNWAMRETH